MNTEIKELPGQDKCFVAHAMSAIYSLIYGHDQDSICDDIIKVYSRFFSGELNKADCIAWRFTKNNSYVDKLSSSFYNFDGFAIIFTGCEIRKDGEIFADHVKMVDLHEVYTENIKVSRDSFYIRVLYAYNKYYKKE
jgi:hypothetical protein